MTPPPITIRALPATPGRALDDCEIIWIPMTAEDRRRVRRLLEASDGTLLALELPTGTVLRPRQVLHLAGRRAYVVGAAPEDVLVIRPRDLTEAARAGHLIGNLHRDIDLANDGITVLWDAPLEERLRRSGVPVERTRGPFHGSAPVEHHH